MKTFPDYIKVVLPAGEIPIDADSCVTKVNGTKELILRSQMRAFAEDRSVRTITCDEKSLLLVSPNGDASVISKETELIWIVEMDVFKSFLREKED